MQLLLAPILAFKKSSNVDEFMVENQRTRMRQNYVLQRALNNDMDTKKIGMTYVNDPNPEELPALIVDYANMIRNDIILLDNSVETRTRKRGNIKVEKINQVGPVNEVPCRCELETKEPMSLDAGADHFPSSVETRVCDASLCPNPYKCHPRLHNITVLKRNRKLMQTDELFEEELPEDFPKHWVAIKKPVIVACLCLRNYDGRS
ncbi:prothoracicotropic hormone-like [Maniola hyperantus]|uniref:prothoracicotropic hormone-like n=1 Tax=Aphantopus hyperantus TaxID=2795564 RepID=UPI003749CB82